MISQLQSEIAYTYKDAEYQKKLISEDYKRSLNDILMVSEDHFANVLRLKETIENLIKSSRDNKLIILELNSNIEEHIDNLK